MEKVKRETEDGAHAFVRAYFEIERLKQEKLELERQTRRAQEEFHTWCEILRKESRYQ